MVYDTVGCQLTNKGMVNMPKDPVSIAIIGLAAFFCIIAVGIFVEENSKKELKMKCMELYGSWEYDSCSLKCPNK